MSWSVKRAMLWPALYKLEDKVTHKTEAILWERFRVGSSQIEHLLPVTRQVRNLVHQQLEEVLDETDQDR